MLDKQRVHFVRAERAREEEHLCAKHAVKNIRTSCYLVRKQEFGFHEITRALMEPQKKRAIIQ